MSHLVASDAPPYPATSAVRPRLARLPRWIVFGLLIRVVLMPFHHPWDLQTWYNMFVDLAQGHSPYATFHELSASYRSERGLVGPEERLRAPRDMFYEYYAYPPLLMMLYYPLAKLSERVIPLEHQFVIHGPAAAVVVPPAFHLFFKPPLFLAEVGIAILLARLAGEDAARRFFLNPLVILISATWTVDALMAFGVVLSLYLLRRERYLASAVSLAAGALIKFLPGVLLPAILLSLWHRGVSRRTIAAYAATFAAVCLVVVLPFWDGFREVLLFHAARPGGTLTPHQLIYPLSQFTRLNIGFLAYFVSPLIGVITLTAALTIVYALLARRSYPLTQSCIITLLAFMLGSKLVNESYPYVLVALLALELGEHPGAAKERVFKLLYALPLAFAFVNSPIVYIVAPVYRYFWQGNFPVSYDWVRAFPVKAHAVLLTAMAFAFTAALIYAIRVMRRRGEHGETLAAAY